MHGYREEERMTTSGKRGGGEGIFQKCTIKEKGVMKVTVTGFGIIQDGVILCKCHNLKIYMKLMEMNPILPFKM